MKDARSTQRRLIGGLALGLILVAWLYWPEASTDIDSDGTETSGANGSDPSLSGSVGPSGNPESDSTSKEPTISLTPSATAYGQMLLSPDGSGDEDNDVIESLFFEFRKLLQGGNPVGMNEDITAAILGDNANRLAFLPSDHPAIREGQIHDRWGTPFWFHSASANVMEIRSAGPDKTLFTGDDIVLNDTGVEATLYSDEGEGEAAGESDESP